MRSSLNPEVLSDSSLLQQVEQGSRHAFDLLFEKHWSAAYSSAYRRLRDADQAKDIIQDIFTHIWLNREILHIRNLPAYLSRAVRNRVIKIVAKQKLSHPFFNILEDGPGSELGADKELLWKEFFRAYEQLVAAFPAKRQLIFRMRFENDLSTKDIAQELGLSRKTVQNQLHKAIEQLRVNLTHLLVLYAVMATLFK
jgi:RNA polymerase sigma-70 factor (ECF subfamily)